jgi:predicted RNA-binding Zn ribbon-like protein
MPDLIDSKKTRRRLPRFELVAGDVCLDFINTLDDRFRDEPKELLKSYVDLARFGEDSGILTAGQTDHLFQQSYVQPREAQHALAAAIQLREVMYEVFWALVHRKPAPPATLFTLNEYIQDAAQHFKLAPAKGHFEWRYEDARNDFLRPVWAIARAAADLLASENVAYVRACSSETCQWLFLDSSKNHRRRWCDMKLCGNRAKFRRFYKKQKRASGAQAK